MKLQFIVFSILSTGLLTACMPDNTEMISTPVPDRILAEQKKAIILNFDIHRVSAQGVAEKIGTITAKDGAEGLYFKTNLQGLTPGEHGFHVHQNPDCGPGQSQDKSPAAAAGGHYDPTSSDLHNGPGGNGHKGDLPLLTVDNDGNANQTIIAPHLKLADLEGRALVIHQGGDNFSDQPKPLGGGGERIACGITK